MKTLLGTGLSGLVGSKFIQLYGDQYDIHNLDLSMGVDITDLVSVRKYVTQFPGAPLVHFAAFTDVSKAHQEKGDKSGIVYKVNVLGTKNIVQVARENNSYLIHISTAYVFDGEKPTPYVENDPIHPIEWYGQTKAWAEEEVVNSSIQAAILRIDQPYREDEFAKLDVLHRIQKGLADNSLPPMFTDHTFTPTRIEQFSQYLDECLQRQLTGIYHATTDPVTTDYDFALWVKEKSHLAGEVRQGSLAEYLKTTNRPYQKNTALNTNKLKLALNLS